MSGSDRVTIYDVADRAGVAISTVSRVLNDSEEVAEATRERVRDAIDYLQYRPQRSARSLADSEARSLAVAVPTFTSYFYNEILKGVKDRLDDDETDLLLFNLGSRSPEETLHRSLKRGAVDALLLVTLPAENDLKRELQKLRAPVVLVGNRTDEFDCFYWDDVLGSRLAVDHLIDRGHREIGMIAAHAWSYSTEERTQGYRDALEAAGIEVDPELIQKGSTRKHAGYSEEAGYEAMEELLDRAPDLTAVFAGSDVQAVGAAKALRDRGRRIPEDVALVGFDDIKLSRFLDFTTIDHHLHEIGLRATRLLLRRMDGENVDPVREYVEPDLIVRGSS